MKHIIHFTSYSWKRKVRWEFKEPWTLQHLRREEYQKAISNMVLNKSHMHGFSFALLKISSWPLEKLSFWGSAVIKESVSNTATSYEQKKTHITLKIISLACLTTANCKFMNRNDVSKTTYSNACTYSL